MSPGMTAMRAVSTLTLILITTTSCSMSSGCPVPTPEPSAARPVAVSSRLSEDAAAGEAKPRVTIPADTLHGHVIPDPYRWLEDFESQRA